VCRVWAIGKMLDSSGREAESAPWHAPKEMMHLPADGVAQLSCGAHASAVVSGDGQLYMWGRLLEYHHAGGAT
jgi:alpha-tubulin suppressor-like RCC1 family protein